MTPFIFHQKQKQKKLFYLNYQSFYFEELFFLIGILLIQHFKDIMPPTKTPIPETFFLWNTCLDMGLWGLTVCDDTWLSLYDTLLQDAMLQKLMNDNILSEEER